LAEFAVQLCQEYRPPYSAADLADLQAVVFARAGLLRLQWAINRRVSDESGAGVMEVEAAERSQAPMSAWNQGAKRLLPHPAKEDDEDGEAAIRLSRTNRERASQLEDAIAEIELLSVEELRNHWLFHEAVAHVKSHVLEQKKMSAPEWASQTARSTVGALRSKTLTYAKAELRKANRLLKRQASAERRIAGQATLSTDEARTIKILSEQEASAFKRLEARRGEK
jgi:hypothetical protein